jgi:dTDP-4-dehydrorhamnose reductase
MSRWLITGAGGMLGSDLTELVRADGSRDVRALKRSALDITDPAQCVAAVNDRDVVINTAAWTGVDASEEHEAAATAVNGGAVATLAEACQRSGAILIHLSTDYVFPGDARDPYPEQAPTDPVNAYGRSKLAGERAVAEILPERGYVVRTSWLYGRNGKNFVQTMLGLAAKHATLTVVNDQLGQPTWTRAVAAQIIDLAVAAQAGHAPAGIYHGTASGETTWHGLAREAFRLAGLDPERIRPVSSDRFPRPARRPAYSVLGHDRWHAAGVAVQPSWEIQLKEAFAAGVFAAASG